MSTRQFAFSHCQFHVSKAEPRIVASLDSGRIAVSLNPLGEYILVDLIGTPDELQWLADKLRAIVTAHESSTKLAGEAAARVAETAVPCWCRGRDAMDPCGHADTSEGCPAHDRNARAEYLAELHS